LEQFRLLTTLGHALRGLQAALHSAGLASPASLGSVESGPIGHLISLQVEALTSLSVRPRAARVARSHT
jgi:hypothetical protein